jgi:hypothetical protein
VLLHCQKSGVENLSQNVSAIDCREGLFVVAVSVTVLPLSPRLLLRVDCWAKCMSTVELTREQQILFIEQYFSGTAKSAAVSGHTRRPFIGNDWSLVACVASRQNDSCLHHARELGHCMRFMPVRDEITNRARSSTRLGERQDLPDGAELLGVASTCREPRVYQSLQYATRSSIAGRSTRLSESRPQRYRIAWIKHQMCQGNARSRDVEWGIAGSFLPQFHGALPHRAYF